MQISQCRRLYEKLLFLIKSNYKILLIAFFPVLLLLINRNWIFFENPYGGNVDSWVNTGYFINYEDYYKIFGQLYYGDRVSWIFPGYFLNHIFSPLIANYLLHIIFFSLALISLFFIIKLTFDENTAFVISLMMGSYTFFVREIGSNYVPGSVITYLLLTVLFLTLAAKFKNWKICLCISGIFFASMIYAHMFAIVFTPFFIAYYIIANYFWRKNNYFISLVYFVAGISFITIIYGIINDLLIGNWFFYSAQLSSFLYYTHTKNPLTEPFLSYVFRLDSLIFPVIFFIICFLSVLILKYYKIKIKIFFPIIFQLGYILIFVMFVLIDMRGNPVLEVPFYNCYLIPFIFLAMAYPVSLILNEIKGHLLDLFLIFSIFLFSLPLIIYNFTPFYSPIVKYLAIFAFMVCLIIMTFKSKLEKINFKKILFSSLLVILCISYIIFNCCLYTSNAYTNIDFHNIDSQENGYVAIMDSMRIINQGISTDNVRFWYNINETNENGYYGGLYGSINSVYLWMYTYISQDFPNIDKSKFETPFYWPQPPPKVVILSTDANAFQEAQDSLNNIGYNATFISEKEVKEGKIEFNITFIQIAEK
jgi:hypothetical protein